MQHPRYKPQEVMNLLRQEVWLANESSCLLQKSVAMTIRSCLWMPTCGSVYAGLDASLKGICSSSLVTGISIRAHLTSTDKSLLSITKSHKPQSFRVAVSILLLFWHSLQVFVLPSNMGFQSCLSKVFANNLLFFILCPPGYCTVYSAHLLPTALFLVAWCFN